MGVSSDARSFFAATFQYVPPSRFRLPAEQSQDRTIDQGDAEVATVGLLPASDDLADGKQTTSNFDRTGILFTAAACIRDHGYHGFFPTQSSLPSGLRP